MANVLNRLEVSQKIREFERKIDFIMSIAQATVGIGSPLDPAGMRKETVSFKRLFQELYVNGATLEDIPQGSAPVATSGAASAAGGGENDLATVHGGTGASGNEANANSESAPGLQLDVPVSV